MRLGVMCSGNGSNFENIVRTCRSDEVVLMIYNKKKCGALKRAQKLGIAHAHIKSADEDHIIQLFQAWRVDLIVLAGWMKIVSPKLTLLSARKKCASLMKDPLVKSFKYLINIVFLLHRTNYLNVRIFLYILTRFILNL